MTGKFLGRVSVPPNRVIETTQFSSSEGFQLLCPFRIPRDVLDLLNRDESVSQSGHMAQKDISYHWILVSGVVEGRQWYHAQYRSHSIVLRI